jgi:hypothetical protein
MTLRSRLFVPALVAALVAPAMAQANTVLHRTPGEASFSYNPEHFESTRSRGEVRAEVDAARKDGTLLRLQSPIVRPFFTGGPAKTREQVLSELRDMSDRDSRAIGQIYTGG